LRYCNTGSGAEFNTLIANLGVVGVAAIAEPDMITTQ